MRLSLRRALTIATLSVALTGFAGVAAGGPGASPTKDSPVPASKPGKRGDSDCAQARKRGKACKIEFEKGDTVRGGVASGSGESITAPGAVQHSSLIRVRTSFRDLIIRTAESL